MLALIIIVAIALPCLMLAAALAPMLARAGQSWPEADPDHRIARPYREAPAPAPTVVRTPRPLRQWPRAKTERDLEVDVVIYQYRAPSLEFDLSDLGGC